MMLSGMDESELFSAEGKQKLANGYPRAQFRRFSRRTPASPGVEAVYFTNFVMQ